MKLVSPCCQNVQEYNPRSKVTWSKKRVTACKKCGKQFIIKKDHVIKVEGKKKARKAVEKRVNSATSSTNTGEFIDDPDELLMSVAIRELNKPDPDPRWASILINCKKENINTKGADIESYRKLPNEVLASLLKKSKLKTS